MRKDLKSTSIPSTRLSRVFGMSKTTAGIASNIFVYGANELLLGKKPVFRELLLRPENISRIVLQLSKMRGAALKVGQLLSLETNEFLPETVTEQLATLRNDVHKMPTPQLKEVLSQSYGKAFLNKFKSFDVNPIACASIGQVHKATKRNGCEIAIKIQYPGIRDSIDSDIKNLSILLSASKLIPESIDLKSLLNDAKKQLLQESDYLSEAESMTFFSKNLCTDDRFEVPLVDKELTTENTLAMEYKVGSTIEKSKTVSQNERDKLAYNLFDLFFKELFELRTMQTDPNYANFLVSPDIKKIILLDFGASQKISLTTALGFQSLLNSTLIGNKEKIKSDMISLGILDPKIPTELSELILSTFEFITNPIRTKTVYDFENIDFIEKVGHLAHKLSKYEKVITLPTLEILLIQRKIAGLFLLSRHLKAKINLSELVKSYAS